jgi:RNA polymerase sigma factor (sigma-70 family)
MRAVSRAALFTKHQDLATALAQEWFLPGADMDDVHQEARLALWVATGTWDPERGPFRMYARHAIRADLRDKVQAANRLKQRVLTDAGRDAQLSLVTAGGIETLVEQRAELERAVRGDFTPQEQQRQRWREAKRRATG